MPLPFTIYLNQPSILVQPTNSLMDLSSADNLGAFGEVVQTNMTTISFSIGDIVFYNVSDGTAISYSGDGSTYVVIDEDKILFKEGSPL